jgi:hypothetical protein
MARKRKRNKRKDKNGPEFEGSRGLAKGTRFIDQDLIHLCRRLGIRIRMSLFGPGGFRCVRCGYATSKRGTAGRNTLRGHHKGHLHEDDAGTVMLRSILLITGVLVAAILWRFFGDVFGSGVMRPLLNSEPSTLVGVGYAVASILTLLWVITSTNMLLGRYSRTKRWVFLSSLATTIFLALTGCIAVSGFVDIGTNPLWFISGLLPLLTTALAARPAGLKRLQYRRRKLPPANYIPRFKALTEVGDDVVDDVEFRINQLVRTKKLTVDMLNRREKLALIALGIKMPGLQARMPDN